MKLKPGAASEYKRRHDEIWPEVVTLLREHGFSDYSIFLDEQTSTLFGVYQASLITTTSDDALRQTEIMQRWLIYMADLMESNEDQMPITRTIKMVFHMD